jgi:hypothetical protein
VTVDLDDDIESAAALLTAERDENTCRKDMAASELVALGRRLEDLERPKAEARAEEGRARGRAAQKGEPVSARPRDIESREETRNVVGKALGMHGATYDRTKYVADRAEATSSAGGGGGP